MLDNYDLRDKQVKCEHLKYKTSKIYHSNLAKEVRKETPSLRPKVKYFQSSVTKYHNNLHYIEYKDMLNTV